jgi:hypothetical protein
MVGMLATVFIWIVHLRHPLLLEGAPEFLRTFAVVLVLAVSFLTVLSAAYFLFPDGPSEKAPGLMSSYLQGERERKRWKIMVVAGMLGAINLFGMAIATGA